MRRLIHRITAISGIAATVVWGCTTNASENLADAETVPPRVSTDEPLKELAWLIGTWVDEDEEVSVETVCDWAKNGSFIRRRFTVRVDGDMDMEGTQVIGWDPATKAIRSWVFDTDGGFGEGRWRRDGDRWIIKATAVLPNGRRASAINILTPIDQNTFTWESTDRELDGELLPNIDKLRITRAVDE